MGIDSRECLHCCHHVYVWVSARHAYWVLVKGFLNEKDGVSGTGRDDSRLGAMPMRAWEFRPFGLGEEPDRLLEPVVDEEKRSPVAGMTVDGMVQKSELGIPKGLSF